MGASSSIKESDVVFSLRQAETTVEVIWKVRTSILTGNLRKYKSPEFKFQNTTWALKIYPYGISKTKALYVGLYLEQAPLLYSIFMWKCSVVGELNKLFHTRICSVGFSEIGISISNENSLGWSDFLDRKKLLDGKLGKVLSDDILTIQCEIQVDENRTLTESFFGSNILSEFPHNNCDCSLSKDLKNALDKGLNFDVILNIEGKKIQAHKVILSARSKVFEAMFRSNMKENQDNVVNLVDLKEPIAKEMLLYMYTGKVRSLSTEKAVDLYTVSEKYLLHELRDKCRDFIVHNLSVDNITAIAGMLHLHNDEVLSESIKRFLAKNIKEVIKSDGWLALSKHNSQFYLDLLNTAVSKEGFL